MFKPKMSVLALIAAAGLAAAQPAAADDTDARHEWLKKFDRNGDGILGPDERRHARYLYKRVDVNDDGRIGPREQRYARNLRQHADWNNDGRIGPRERAHARRVLNHVDRHR